MSRIHPGQTVRLTLLMHPGGKVHLTTGILPRTDKALARDWVNPGLSVLAPSLRCGPLLIDADKVRLPKVASFPADQLFTHRDTPTTWKDDPILAATQSALLPDTAPEVQEGWVRIDPNPPAADGDRGLAQCARYDVAAAAILGAHTSPTHQIRTGAGPMGRTTGRVCRARDNPTARAAFLQRLRPGVDVDAIEPLENQTARGGRRAQPHNRRSATRTCGSRSGRRSMAARSGRRRPERRRAHPRPADRADAGPAGLRRVRRRRRVVLGGRGERPGGRWTTGRPPRSRNTLGNVATALSCGALYVKLGRQCRRLGGHRLGRHRRAAFTDAGRADWPRRTGDAERRIRRGTVAGIGLLNRDPAEAGGSWTVVKGDRADRHAARRVVLPDRRRPRQRHPVDRRHDQAACTLCRSAATGPRSPASRRAPRCNHSTSW